MLQFLLLCRLSIRFSGEGGNGWEKRLYEKSLQTNTSKTNKQTNKQKKKIQKHKNTKIQKKKQEIAFKKVDLDVWLVNFWVSVFQFLCGLTYAPLAAVMSGLAVVDIPQNLYRGFLCFLIGKNFIGNEVNFY